MKPVAFEYAAPATVEEAVALLCVHGSDAKVLAGGQSLMPMLNFRLVRPAMIVDVNRVEGIDHVRVVGGALRIGALTRTACLEFDPVVAAGWPLLREAATFVAHPAIRNRGTVGGSAAHADPHAELPAALCSLDARFHVLSERGARVIGASDFFQDYYTTALEPDELLVEIEVPAMKPSTGTGFCEHARTHGDFAVAGAAVTITVGADGRCTSASLALLGAGPRPTRVTGAENVLIGRKVSAATAVEAAEAAARACDPPAPQDYRRALVAEMTKRAILQAGERIR